MLPNGEMFGRTVSARGEFTPLASVNVAGDELLFWPEETNPDVRGFAERITQTFGTRTYTLLRRLHVAVIGCSGTGSIVVEQLARNGVGSLVLVDPDVIEEKNLNRILNSTALDARTGTPKVTVLARAITAMGFGTKVETHQCELIEAAAIRAVAGCDVVFGCMDTIDGRHLLNRLATYYLLPYFDLGVKLEADGNGGINQVCGTVNYLQPGGSSLLSRGTYTLEQLRATNLFRTDPKSYAEQRGAGYIAGVNEDRPAVISVNMLIASLAINEFLARLHPYRLEPNRNHSAFRISLSHGLFMAEPEEEPCSLLARHIGSGDVDPLLGLPQRVIADAA
jgi:hypothetical protein